MTWRPAESCASSIDEAAGRLFVSLPVSGCPDFHAPVVVGLGRPMVVLTLLAACLLSGCLPTSDFNVTIRVLDDKTGQPVPNALVLAGALVTVEPALEPPRDQPLAAARGMTGPDGAVRMTRLSGMYTGEVPDGDPLWKMLEAREPKVKRRVIGTEGGSVFILAPGYGLFHQALGVSDSPAFQKRLAVDGRGESDFDGWLGSGNNQYDWNLKPALLATSKQLANGLQLTIRVKNLGPAHALGSFSMGALRQIAALTSKKTGVSEGEKNAILDFFVRQLKYAVSVSNDPYYADQLRQMENPGFRKEWESHGVEQTDDHDTVVHLWLTKSALGLLGPAYEEVKRHAPKVLKGVEDEDAGLRPLDHFYNPYDPDNKMPLGEQALKWSAIGHPDNPSNDWDWQDALRYYRQGDKDKAYAALGHVLHVLEDLSVPMHTHVIMHEYRVYPREARFETFFGDMARRGNGNLPPAYSVEAREPKRTIGLQEQFDELAKESFGAHAVDGRAVDFDAVYSWKKGGLGGLVKEPDDAALESMGRYLFPRAIEASAGLLARFHDETHPRASVRAPADAQGSATDARPGDSGKLQGGGENMSNVAESDVQSFGYDPESGRMLLLSFRRDPVSQQPLGPLLQIQDRAGAVVREWRMPRNYYISPSVSGRYGLIHGFERNVHTLEVVGMDGNSLWRQEIPVTGSDFRVSDYGTVLQTRSFEGGESVFFNRQGRKSVLNDMPGSDKMGVAWSPHGQALLLTQEDPPRLRCITQDGTTAYDINPTGSDAKSKHVLRRVAVWDDCTSVVAVFPFPPDSDAEFLRLSPKGEIILRKKLHKERPGSDYASISSDLRSFGYISVLNNVHRIEVLDSDSLATLHTFQLLPTESATDLIMGRSEHELAVVLRPGHSPGGPYVFESGQKREPRVSRSIRIFRFDKPWKDDLAVSIANGSIPIYFRPRFDEIDGALRFADGREMRHHSASP